MVEHEADIEIPSRTWSNFTPAIGKRGLVRALTPSERSTVRRREYALAFGLLPFGSEDRECVEEAIIGMFGSRCRALRLSEDQLMVWVERAVLVLRKYPAWAIIEACQMIIGNNNPVPDIELDAKFPPADNEIAAVAEHIVQPFRRTHEMLTRLLAAPIDQSNDPEPRGRRPTYAEIQADLAKRRLLAASGISAREFDALPDRNQGDA